MVDLTDLWNHVEDPGKNSLKEILQALDFYILEGYTEISMRNPETGERVAVARENLETVILSARSAYE